MAFSVSTLKGIKVYNLTFGKTQDQWREEQRQGEVRSLRYSEAYRRRIEFIQEATFPTASLKVEMSDDGMWMMATGIYPPKIKMFNLSELTMKFERGLESEAIDFTFLGKDWEKFVILREHRWMEFHSRHGRHYNMRIPKMGTCLSYNKAMTELYCGTVENIVLRANLEQGRYYAPYETELMDIRACDTDKTHLLSAFGSSEGVVECWDPRCKKQIAKLDMFDSIPEVRPVPEISKLKFGNDGLTLAVGMGDGHIGVYDLRRQTPLHLLNHRNRSAIKSISFHQQSSKIISCDCRNIRYWEQTTGELYTVINPPEVINDIAIVENSGVVFVAQEQHRIGAYYVPSVGLAPKWCPFLDNMTEELEESRYKSIYIDYKFVSRDELEALGLEHLIGTNILKPYMHGFFMDIGIYRRVRSIVDPDAYSKFLKKKTEEKLEAQRTGRIKIKRKLPKVNKSYANYLLKAHAAGTAAEKKEGKGSVLVMNPLLDPRFSQMFNDEDFTIDHQKDEYLKNHPEITYAIGQHEYHQYVKAQKEKELGGEVAQIMHDVENADDDDDDDNKDRYDDYGGVTAIDGFVEDNDITVGANQETYDDKFFSAKDYSSTLAEDYRQETRLHSLLDRSDNEDDSSMEDMQFAEKIKVDGRKRDRDNDGYGQSMNVEAFMEEKGIKGALRRIDGMEEDSDVDIEEIKDNGDEQDSSTIRQ